MKKSGIVIAVALAVSVLLISCTSALFIGITDGYVRDNANNFVPGANVTVTVSGCSGGSANGCVGSALVGSNGYYIVNNLNLPKGGGVSASAVNGSGTGSSSGTADNFQIAHVNITICYPPSSPSLTPVADSHNTTVFFEWVSGSDPYARPVYDEFNLDNVLTNYTNQTNTTRVGLSMGSHTWRVKTCNNYCCSGLTSDTFVSLNGAPSAPNSTNHSTNGTITSLTWVSGSDSDGDPVYDELQYSNGTVVSGVSSPFNVTTANLIRWAVRTCDNFGACSDWVWTDSVTCGNITTACETCPVCEVCDDEGDGGGSTGSRWTGGGVGCRKVAMTCNGIAIGEDILLSLNLQLGPNGKKITILGLNLTLEDLEYCPWCYNGAKDYDEEGVDCGGSCRDCSEEEAPMIQKENDWIIVIVVGAIAGILALLGWIIEKYALFKGVRSLFK